MFHVKHPFYLNSIKAPSVTNSPNENKLTFTATTETSLKIA